MRLLKNSLALLALILGLSVEANANTDLAVVTKQHLDSRGGADRVSGLQRYEMTGTITRNGESLPMKVWWKYPNKLRVEIGTGDKMTTSIYDGKTAWVIEPGPWGKEPAGMAPGFRELCARQADFGGPLVYPEKKGIKVVPDPETWGDAGYLFHIERADGKKDKLFIDPNMRLPKIETYQVDSDTYAEVRYSKYRRTEGFAVPSHIERFIDGKLVEVIEVSEFVIAPEKPDSHFAVRPPNYDGSSAANLVDLKSLDDLRGRFQADEGRVRMVAFFSPTSAEGRRGFDELRNTLNLIKDERLRAYVVWTGVVDSDCRSAAAARTSECSDQRIIGFWDQNQAAATEWCKIVSTEHPVWNAYFVNGPTARWESKPPVPEHWLQGNSINASSDGMDKIKSMLAEIPENPKGSKGSNAKR